MKKLIIPLALLMAIGLSANAQTENNTTQSNEPIKMEKQENRKIDLPDEKTTIFIKFG